VTLTRPKLNLWFSLSLLMFFSVAVHAQGLRNVQVTFAEPWATTAVHDVKSKAKGKSNVRVNKLADDLAKIRAAEVIQKYDLCVSLAQKLIAAPVDLAPWVRVQTLRCERLAFDKNKKKYKEFSDLVVKTWDNAAWLLKGAHVISLRQESTNSTLALIDYEAKSRRKNAWANINRLTSVKEWLDHHSLAQLYRLAGEISFAEQNGRAAADYLSMSLREEPNPSVESQLRSLKKSATKETVVAAKDAATKDKDVVASGDGDQSEDQSGSDETADANKPVATDGASPGPSPEPTRSNDEAEIYARFREESKAQNYLTAIDDGMLLLKNFSGGAKAQAAAKQIINIYLAINYAVSQKADEKLQGAKKDALDRMKKADGQRLSDWATVLAAKGLYSDAVELSQGSLEQIGGQPLATKVILLCALSAYHAADFKKARDLFTKLAREHGGTKAAAEATYRLGIMNFRESRFAEAGEQFDKYLGLDSNADFEASALYWQWRAQQKLGFDRAGETAEKLISKYPLSYFGLRARADLKGGLLSFDRDLKTKVQISLALTAADQIAWEHFKTLTQAGWFDEAKAELLTLPMPDTAEAKLIFADFWSRAHDYIKASELLLAAFQKEPSYVTLAAIRVIYPLDYSDDIKREIAKYRLPLELVQALIKQESSFRTEVKSPVGAIGLMQLLPSTAREVGYDMHIHMPDVALALAQPQTNLRIGTNYLHRKLKIFDGQVPLALAAYNAGIGNIRSWLRSRGDLRDLVHSQTSQPEAELWFDELPWPETSGYIKGILRNLMVYRLLNQGEYTLTDPLWKLPEKPDPSI
jgi:soluble lytic murein transglycosylase